MALTYLGFTVGKSGDFFDHVALLTAVLLAFRENRKTGVTKIWKINLPLIEPTFTEGITYGTVRISSSGRTTSRIVTTGKEGVAMLGMTFDQK